MINPYYLDDISSIIGRYSTIWLFFNVIYNNGIHNQLYHEIIVIKNRKKKHAFAQSFYYFLPTVISLFEQYVMKSTIFFSVLPYLLSFLSFWNIFLHVLFNVFRDFPLLLMVYSLICSLYEL